MSDVFNGEKGSLNGFEPGDSFLYHGRPAFYLFTNKAYISQGAYQYITHAISINRDSERMGFRNSAFNFHTPSFKSARVVLIEKCFMKNLQAL
jgi:hypothetical protein